MKSGEKAYDEKTTERERNAGKMRQTCYRLSENRAVGKNFSDNADDKRNCREAHACGHSVKKAVSDIIVDGENLTSYDDYRVYRQKWKENTHSRRKL